MTIPGDEEILTLYQKISNWGRFGAADERGTLNLITAEKCAAAAALVKDGKVVSCAMPIDTLASPRNREPAQHHMLCCGDMAPAQGYANTSDYIGVAFHGPAFTHLDALCHVVFDGKMYNGFPAASITSKGALKGDTMAAAPAVVSRGVLLDMPEALGIDYVPSDRWITRADLEAAEQKFGVRPEPGDVLLIRKGRQKRYCVEGADSERLEGKTHMPGLHPDCLEYLRDRDISLLGSDAAHDILPTPWARARVPIHTGALVYLGLHLLDNVALDDVAATAKSCGRYEFQFIMAPLLIKGGTGSPVNPVAIF
jgi:kynurenine formamidase